tara:strand:- start:2654 stop:5062 length:2409 start_codon:yes stop_codon:yes gene_type:complete
MNTKSAQNYFPSQVVSDQEKNSYEYGLKVGQAIEAEWFGKDFNSNRFSLNQQDFHKLRLYARGEQSVQKYKDELSINGDLSYLNLDWTPVPVIPKFVDIVVNGIAERAYDIKAYSQDPFGVQKRTEYMESIIRDMQTAEFQDEAINQFGINLYENDKAELPGSQEELELHMQLTYKQSIEIAEEQAINVLFDGNKYDQTLKRLYYDITVLGIAAVKNNFDTSSGITVDYVDPANLVYSYTESPYFDDIYYCGEVKNIPINELKKQFPQLTNEDLSEIEDQPHQSAYAANRYSSAYNDNNVDNNIVQVLYFNYKTYNNEVYKLKQTGTGGSKAIQKDDSFEAVGEVPFEKLSNSLEVLYEGALILGTKKLLKWNLAKNMLRPKSDYTKVKMNYAIHAPRIYKGKIESLVKRVTGFADMIQLTHLKLQQVMSRLVPDGVYLDADGLAEVDLGNGTNYNPQEALNMFFQTGSIIGRSMTQEGDPNPGKVPIQEISSGSGGQKLQSLITTYNYYLQMIRDVTGLNEARDASTPDSNALVGVQKLAAANSNVATRHILRGGLFLTSELAENLSLRISDVIEYSPTRDAFIQAIGAHNVATLAELSELHLYDFGIFLQLQPDEEEKQLLENNIQMALQANSIELEDAIDIREVRNIKLANQLLKLRRKKKIERDQAIAQQNIQQQAQANAQAQQVAAQAEVQKQQAIQALELQNNAQQAELDANKLQLEAELKKQLMEQEFQYNLQLKQADKQTARAMEENREDRKDTRVVMQGMEQRKTAASKNKNFESSGNDIISGDIGLGRFEPS